MHFQFVNFLSIFFRLSSHQQSAPTASRGGSYWWQSAVIVHHSQTLDYCLSARAENFASQRSSDHISGCSCILRYTGSIVGLPRIYRLSGSNSDTAVTDSDLICSDPLDQGFFFCVLLLKALDAFAVIYCQLFKINAV